MWLLSIISCQFLFKTTLAIAPHSSAVDVQLMSYREPRVPLSNLLITFPTLCKSRCYYNSVTWYFYYPYRNAILLLLSALVVSVAVRMRKRQGRGILIFDISWGKSLRYCHRLCLRHFSFRPSSKGSIPLELAGRKHVTNLLNIKQPRYWSMARVHPRMELTIPAFVCLAEANPHLPIPKRWKVELA